TASDRLIRRPARPAGAGRAGPFSRTARRGHREEAELRVVAVAVEIEPPSSRRGGLPLERLEQAGAGVVIQGVPAVHEVDAVPVDGVPLDIDIVRAVDDRSEEHTSELQSRVELVCRLLFETKKKRTRK